MNSKVKNQYTEETHPWNWCIPEKATKLLIGTFPSDLRNRKHDFFYCSSTNRCWEVLASLSKHSMTLLDGLDGVQERKKILDNLKLGLTDMGKRVLRQQGSSKDHSLFPIEFMDIVQIVEDYPNIDTFILTGDVQGNSSLSWFITFCSINNSKFNVKELIKIRHTTAFLFGKSIKLILAYSPSRLSRIKTEQLVKEYDSIINSLG